MRRRTAAGIVLALASLSVGPSPPEKGDDAFVSLFDGQSLDGWTPVSTDRFFVRQGVIVNDGGTGWLRGDKVYKDFHLIAEYRALRDGSDSGLFFRATAESDPKPPHWPSRCYQLQIVDGPSHFMLFGHGAQSRFDRDVEALASVVKRPGQWQTLSLKVLGGRAEAALDGVLVTVSDAIELSEGRLGLQGENGLFEWRSLRIKELRAP
ncbi:MAG: DUF1080 domain-containing protein [Isosphaeraceae bacterium]